MRVRSGAGAGVRLRRLDQGGVLEADGAGRGPPLSVREVSECRVLRRSRRVWGCRGGVL